MIENARHFVCKTTVHFETSFALKDPAPLVDLHSSVRFQPMAAGIYKVNLLSRGEHIKDSPFVAQVADAEEGFHPSAGRVSGPAKPIYTVGEPVPFKIDNRLVGGSLRNSEICSPLENEN